MEDPLRLDGGGDSLVVGVRDGRPFLDYWGPALAASERPDPRLLDRAVPHGGLDRGEAFDLFPQSGHGFTGRPALEAARSSGGFITQLTVRDARREEGAIRIELADEAASLAVALEITLHATGVAGFRATLRNEAAAPLRLDWLSPVALPAAYEELLAFGGRWAGEFSEHRLRVETGAWLSESRTGRTSHHAPPFVVIGEPGFGDHAGALIGLHLAWSGDHRLLIERLRDGRLQVQAGELFWPGEMTLDGGAAYRTPWLYAARSDAGLNGLSARLHRFVRDEVLQGRLRDRPRPVGFNTWEAVYFDHRQADLEALAEAAAAIGAERFLLDDGWFKGRNDDTTSLGDWTPDPVKYPQGLAPLAAKVRSLGMEFGLWVEPEMANARSDLLEAHPDWILGEPGREQPLGRGQLVLDLTRPEVSEAIFGQLDALLAELPIAYLKWDMNRDLTHPASRGRPASHAQTLAVYALIDRLRAAHPAVEIESCASGGGRADYEILRRTDRIWTSDCNDPIERQRIQRAFSIFFPPEVMGAHVGPADSHTTARRSSLELRAITALFGHMGIEADIRGLGERERAALKGFVELHKAQRATIHGGRLTRQTAPDPGGVAVAVLDEAGGLASLAQLETPRTATLGPLRLRGLDPEAVYEVERLNPPRRPRAAMKLAPALALGEAVRANGRVLAEVGLPSPILRAGEVALYRLRRIA